MPDPIKNLNLDLSGYKEESKPLNLDLSGYTEKKNPVGTSLDESGATKATAGLSATSAPKNNPFGNNPIAGKLPDGSGLKIAPAVSGVVAKPKVKSQKSKADKEDDYSFLDYAADKLGRGVDYAAKSVAELPEMAYDQLRQNGTSDAIDKFLPISGIGTAARKTLEFLDPTKDKKATAEDIKKYYGIRNIPAEHLKERINHLNKGIEEYRQKNGGDALTAIQNKQWGNAAKMIAGETIESLPIMGAAIASGGSTAGNLAIGLSTASQKYAELKDENAEMSTDKKLQNAAVSGLLEATIGSFVEGTSGQALKSILAEKGTKEGAKIIANGFRSVFAKAMEKNPAIGALGEVIEESAVELGNQLNDINSGIRSELDMHEIANAGLSATGMGVATTVPVYGAKAYMKAKDYQTVKNVNREISKLSTQLNQEGVSEESKALITDKINSLVTENRKLLGTELEKVKALPAETKKELVKANNEIEDLKSKAEAVKEDDSLTDDVKQSLLSDLKSKATEAVKKRSEILSINSNMEVSNDFTSFGGVLQDYTIEDSELSFLDNHYKNTLDNGEHQWMRDQAQNYFDDKEGFLKKRIEVAKQSLEKDPESGFDKRTIIDTEKALAELKSQEKTPASVPPNDIVSGPSAETPQAENVSIEKPYSVVESEDGDFKVWDNKKNIYIEDNKGHIRYADEEMAQNHVNELNSVITNESLPPTDIAIDGDIRPTAEPVGESTITGEEVIESESPQPPVDGGAAKGDSEVAEKSYLDLAGEYSDLAHQYTERVKELRKQGISTGGNPDLIALSAKMNEIKDAMKEAGKKEEAELEPETSKAPEPKKPVNQKIKLTEKGQSFVVAKKGDKLVVRKEDGSPVSKPTHRQVLRKYADNVDFTAGERAIDRSDFSGDNDTYYREVAEKSSNAAELADAAVYAEHFDADRKPQEHTLDHKQSIIADGVGKIKESGFNQDADDRNNVTPAIRKNYFDEKGRDIDELAQELSLSGIEITPKDIADFIKEHPNGANEFYKNAKKEAEGMGNKFQAEIDDLKEKFTALTGLPATPEYLKRAIDQKNRKFELDSTLDQMSDEEFAKKYEEYQQLEKEEHGTKEDKPVAEVGDESKDVGDGGEKPKIQSKPDGESNKKPTVQERIKAKHAKIDDWANAAKGIDEIFGIKIKVDLSEGVKRNGFSQDDIIDLIASTAKKAVEAGIHIDEAVSKVVEHFQKTIDFDVDEDAVKDRMNETAEPEAPKEKSEPKKEAPKKEKADSEGRKQKAESKEDDKSERRTFERKQGKRSLLDRLSNGGNDSDITKALKDLNPSYDVRNQEKADADAIAFVDSVGIAEALEAVRSGQIKNADKKMLVFNEALSRLSVEIDKASETNPEDREALIEKFQELSGEMDNMVRDMGQGVAIMNYIYNKNQSLKYSLKKLIEDYKREDINGEIPDSVKAKFEELTEKLKDVEKREKEAKARAEKAEEELAVKNIQESIERSNKGKKIEPLTKEEKTRKKELRNKFFGRLNDVTSMVAMLADSEFREYLGLTFKQAKGDFKNFSKQIIDEVGKGAKQHLPKLFEEANKVANEKKSDKSTEVTVDEKGNIKIPNELIRNYVAEGYTEIDEIAKLILEDIQDEHPDVELRDVRDAITKYGKQVSKTEDDIAREISKMKEYGRLLSAYEDVMNGKMPLKSGLTREKPETRARQLRKDINRLAKELGLDTISPDEQWANALNKVKTHLQNQITDLQSQIDKGEKRKIERTDTVLDDEAKRLKAERDAKKKELDDLVGKPELTTEQKIAKSEKALESSIKKLEKEIVSREIDFKEKPTAVTSAKIERLKAEKKALLDLRKQMRDAAGITEQQKLKTSKTRVKKQIEELQEKIRTKDFAKKENKTLNSDDELNSLRAERESIYEEFEKQKYIQELKNRSWIKKVMDTLLETTAIARAVKASHDLGLIGIQMRHFTYGELMRNPAELGRKFLKMFGAIGSQEKANKAMASIIGHPKYALAKKLDIGITNPDLRNEVREEMASGNALHFAWNLPMVLADKAGLNVTEAKHKAIGDKFIDGVKKLMGKTPSEKKKFSVAEQWSNLNTFEAIERGLSTYGNVLRFEEFLRGVQKLEKEGKDPINHPEDYKLLASYIRTFSGRAKPASLINNQKLLNIPFFSFRNAVSIFQQLNPGYYGYLHTGSSDFKNGKYGKTSVANRMAMLSMARTVTANVASVLFLMAGYNAFKDDDDEEMTIETDPRSSDVGKLKVGSMRIDPWGGYAPLITLTARFIQEEVKKGEKVYKMGEKGTSIKHRGDAVLGFLKNKLSPAAQMFVNYITTHEADSNKKPKKNGDQPSGRLTPFGQDWTEDESMSKLPIFMASVKDAVENNPSEFKSMVTAWSILGLMNVQDYEGGKKHKPQKEKEGDTKIHTSKYFGK